MTQLGIPTSPFGVDILGCPQEAAAHPDPSPRSLDATNYDRSPAET